MSAVRIAGGRIRRKVGHDPVLPWERSVSYRLRPKLPYPRARPAPPFMRSTINADVPVARPGEFAPLALGPIQVDPPVVLAPMAGVTNPPFRKLCRRFGAGLYVSEMVSAHALAHGNEKTRQLASFADDELPRSSQLYGVDPESVAIATRWLVEERGIHHLDLNFGCPVRKVTVNGGGSAIPVKPRLMARIVRAAVANAGAVPVTVKVRKGIDDQLLTFLDAGRVAQEEGCAWIGLHARTASQLYSGEADWSAIGELVASCSIPVLGNGDIWEAFDALRMARATGCAGVIVGRGCLGRPWLFRDLVDVYAGREPQAPPNLGEIVEIALEHAALLVDFLGERTALFHMRKWVTWYTKGFPGTAAFRQQLFTARTLDDLERELRRLPADAPFPITALRVRRAKGARTQKVALPHGYLEDRDDERGLGIPEDPAERAAYERALEGG